MNPTFLVALLVSLVIVLMAMRTERKSAERRLAQPVQRTTAIFVAWPVLTQESVNDHVTRITAMFKASVEPRMLIVGVNSQDVYTSLLNRWQSCGLALLGDNVRLTGAAAAVACKEAARARIMRECFADEEYILHLDPLFVRFLPKWDDTLPAKSGGVGIVTFVPQPIKPAVFAPNPDALVTADLVNSYAGEGWISSCWLSSLFMFAPAALLPQDLHDPLQPDDPRTTSWLWTLRLCALSPLIYTPTTQSIVQGALLTMDTPCHKRRLRAIFGQLPCDICGQPQAQHTQEHALGHDYTLATQEHTLPKIDKRQIPRQFLHGLLL
jgi:hypothetical protein